MFLLKPVDINIIVPKIDELKGIVKGLFNSDLTSCEKNKLYYINPSLSIYLFEPEENNIKYRIALTVINGQNNIKAVISTMQSANLIMPKMMILAGTALGKEGKTELGDIIFSSKIKDISEKRYEQDVAHSMGDTIQCQTPNIMTEIEKYFDKIKNKLGGNIRIKKGEIASGNDYIASDPDKLIWDNNIKSIAYDMESVGFGEACANLNLPWIVTRVITDYGTVNSISKSKNNNNQDRIVNCINLGIAIKSVIEVGALDVVFKSSENHTANSFDGEWRGYMGYKDSEGKIVIYSEEIILQKWQEGFIGYVEGTREGSRNNNSKMTYSLIVSDAALSPISGVWKSEKNENNKNVGSLVANVSSASKTYYMTDIKGVWLGSSSTDGIQQGVFHWFRSIGGKMTRKNELTKIKKLIKETLTKDGGSAIM